MSIAKCSPWCNQQGRQTMVSSVAPRLGGVAVCCWMYPRTLRCVLFAAGLRFSLPQGRELIVGRKGRREEGVIAQYMHEPGSPSVSRLWYPDSGRPVHQPETCHHLCGGRAQGTAHSSEHTLLATSSVLQTVWLWSYTVPGAWGYELPCNKERYSGTSLL